MKKFIIIIYALMMTACASGVSVNLGDPALTAVVNTVMVTNSKKSTNVKQSGCNENDKKEQLQCLQEVAKLKILLARKNK